VTRTFISFPVKDFAKTKQQMLNWANRFNICCFLDNNQYQSAYHTVECLVGAGVHSALSAPAGNALEKLQAFHQQHNDWLFGHLGYDLKNETEGLSSSLPDHIRFPDLFFFVPFIVIELRADSARIGTLDDSANEVWNEILNTELVVARPSMEKVSVQQRFSKEDYLATVNKLRDHILRGDCYEINFCQEFYAEQVSIDPLATYRALGAASPNPFSGYYKVNDKYLVCASPERYLQKSGDKIISQPIKGTWKRDKDNVVTDMRNRSLLEQSAKDRSENVMVVDLVRNDFSRICEEGTVKVSELFKVYTFPQVYQMISTIQGQLRAGAGLSELFHVTFPMGSMTGAPKRSVLTLLEKYERSRRGIFSGALGYISPEGDCDFNVVIRSILYNAETGYLSFPAGSGITFYSDAESEYEECLLKAAAIRQLFE
jgi:para-aminobenzoate synthetase component I